MTAFFVGLKNTKRGWNRVSWHVWFQAWVHSGLYICNTPRNTSVVSPTLITTNWVFNYVREIFVPFPDQVNACSQLTTFWHSECDESAVCAACMLKNTVVSVLYRAEENSKWRSRPSYKIKVIAISNAHHDLIILELATSVKLEEQLNTHSRHPTSCQL